MVDKTIEIIEILGRYVDESRDYSSVATKINALYTEPVSEGEIEKIIRPIYNKYKDSSYTDVIHEMTNAIFKEFKQQRQVKQISEKRIEEIAEYLINSVQKAENHNFTGNLDKYYKGCIDGIKAALKELNKQ